LHRFLLIRLQSGHELAKQGFLITVQVAAAIVVSVRDTNTAAVSLYRKDECGAAERLDIPKNSAATNAEFCHEISDGFLPPIRQQFQHGLPPVERTLHFHTPFRFGSFMIENKGLT